MCTQKPSKRRVIMKERLDKWNKEREKPQRHDVREDEDEGRWIALLSTLYSRDPTPLDLATRQREHRKLF